MELIRDELMRAGLRISARDVFIKGVPVKGVPVEIDLLIPKAEAKPEHGILYNPEDVLVVFEN